MKNREKRLIFAYSLHSSVMKKVLYYIYLFPIGMPLLLIVTILAALTTIIGSALGFGRTMGYWPGHLWARAFCWLTWVRVKVTGAENIDKGHSYVFVANHQGAYDIFAIYGYLGHNFRWMMKKSLEKIPLVGYSCKVSGHIFVDNSSPSRTRTTMQTAEKRLSGGMSVVVFPEGARTLDGRMHAFRRGAYTLAMEFGLPVVPITIDGAFKILPRGKSLPQPGTIRLVVHKPIFAPEGGTHDLADIMKRSSEIIASALPPENQPR